MALFILSAFAHRSAAQVVSVEAGTSTVQQATGATVRFWSDQSEGWVGAGAADGARFGAFVATRLGNGRHRVELGDNALSIRMPTDGAGSSPYFLVRGAGIAGTDRTMTWRVFAGSTADGYSTRFFTSATSDRPVLWLELDRPLSEALSLSSRTAVSGRTTSLHGIRWVPEAGIDASVAAGLGAGDAYIAANAGIVRRHVTARASWSEAGDGFRRQIAASPLLTEPVGVNANITLRPGAGFVVSAARQNFTSIDIAGDPGPSASVATLATTWRRRSLRAGISAHRADVPVGVSGGVSATVASDRISRFAGSLMVWHSSPAVGRSSSGFVANVHARVSPRLELLNVISGTGGQVSASAGGSLTTNPVRASVEYQTIFAPAPSGTLFRQAMVVNAQVQPAGSVKLDLGTQILPDGRVRYYAKAATYLYPGRSGYPGDTRFRMPSRLIRGRVIDDEGAAVSGAAVRIGDQLAFTDSRGEFFVRTARSTAQDITVATDEFLRAGTWQVVYAPARAIPADAAGAEPIAITVRRIAPTR